MIIHILILTLAVALLSGMSFHTEETITEFDVILVADASSSAEGSTETMNEYIRKILDEENASEFNIGIVTFANDQVYVSELSHNPDKVYDDYINSNKKPDASATDIASALNYAKGLLSELTNSRLIILSDGLETDGDALLAAKAIAEEGVRVDAIHLDSEGYKNEVQINLVEVADDAFLGTPTTVTVTLQSTGENAVKLILKDNGEACDETVVNLHGGVGKVEFVYEFTEPGLHEMTVELESETDTLEQNNKCYSYAYIDALSNVLIVDGTGDESDQIKELLEKEGYGVTVVDPDGVPRTMTKLREYAQVILMNVNVSDLPTSYDNMLNNYVYQHGGGLFTVGGQNTYGLGGMEGTHFDDMLPITMDSDNEQVLELMIVLDISSSMDKTMANSGRTRISVAKDGVVESINALKDSDYVGIVTFDASASVLEEISPATRRDQIIRKVDSLKTGMGTAYSGALSTAANRLRNSRNNADKQHVIFITDGNPQDSGYESTIRMMHNQGGITVSTIAIFTEDDPDLGDINALKNRVQNMASIGGGRSYVVTDAREFATIMAEETKLSQRELVNEETVFPSVRDYSAVIQGIDKLPKLEGYIGVSPKVDATVVYAAGDDPIYVEWQYGNGFVGSFTSDLSGDWSRQFLQDENGQTFVCNVVKNLQSAETGMEVEFVNENYSTVLNVTQTAVAGHSMTANITDPNGAQQTIILTVTGSEGYSGKFATETPGVYRVFVSELDAEGNNVATCETYTTFSYSKEYDAFTDPLDGYMRLDEICQGGGGRILHPTEQLFSKESLSLTHDYDPRMPLIIIALVLFLLDIAVRKFNFKWPHEIIRDRKERKMLKSRS